MKMLSFDIKWSNLPKGLKKEIKNKGLLKPHKYIYDIYEGFNKENEITLRQFDEYMVIILTNTLLRDYKLEMILND
jgi:hypothetical protein